MTPEAARTHPGQDDMSDQRRKSNLPLGITPPRLLHFEQAVSRIVSTHLTPKEFYNQLAVGSAKKTIALHKEIDAWPETLIPLLAYRLTGIQLAHLLRSLIDPIDESLRERIEKLLSLRMKKHQCRMAWCLLQNQSDNSALARLMQDVTRQEGQPPFMVFFQIHSIHPDATLIDRILDKLLEKIDQPDLLVFMATYDIDPDGGIAQDLTTRFFTSCGATGFSANSNSLARIFQPLQANAAVTIDRTAYAEVLAPSLNNYIESVNPLMYQRGNMRLLLDTYGSPDPDTLFWDRIDKSAHIRFSQWIHMDQIRSSLYPALNKIRVVSMFYEQIENVISDLEDTLLYVYFSRFVLLNLPDRPQTMMLYPRRLFSETFDRFSLARTTEATAYSGEEDQPVKQEHKWPLDETKVIPARTAILSPQAEKNRRRTIAQVIVRGEAEIIVELKFEDTPILYARQFILELIG